MNFDIKELPYSQFEQLGMSKKDVLNLKPQDLTNMLQGKRTGLQSLTIPFGEGIKPIIADVKLSLNRNPDNTVSVGVHPILAKPTNNIEATPEQWEKLLKGEPIIKNTKSLNGSVEPHLHQLDKQTNEILSVRSSTLQLPNSIVGNVLNPEQKELLRNGHSIALEDKHTKENITVRLDLNEAKGFALKGETQELIQSANTNTNSAKPVLIPPISKEMLENELHYHKHGSYLNNNKITNKELSYVPDVIDGFNVSKSTKILLLIGLSLTIGPAGLLAGLALMGKSKEQQPDMPRYFVNDENKLVKQDIKTGITPINHSQVVFNEQIQKAQQKVAIAADAVKNIAGETAKKVVDLVNKVKDPITSEGYYLVHFSPKNMPEQKTTFATNGHEYVYEGVQDLLKNEIITVEKIKGLSKAQKENFLEDSERYIGKGEIVLTGMKDNIEIKEAFLMRSFKIFDKESGKSIAYEDGKNSQSTGAKMKI